jgi:hypothetical protein
MSITTTNVAHIQEPHKMLGTLLCVIGSTVSSKIYKINLLINTMPEGTVVTHFFDPNTTLSNPVPKGHIHAFHYNVAISLLDIVVNIHLDMKWF